ncbi:DIS3 mitotic control [Perkinsus chesapeaki]|uniref:DIS3 mitotic control n=1 Tax=Perkinsus chesapeaki TaxID=330153 RepID=A0A7J6LBY4_PERCH|nr:DIS3 mitotic control [Perkinsus chesapeaki]
MSSVTSVRYGRLHVPAFETNQAFLELEDDKEGKVRVRVPGFMARNRALHGDSVMARLMWKAYKRDNKEMEEDSPSGKLGDARARVVAVISRNERPVVGLVRPGETKVQPRDQRLPAMTLEKPFDAKGISTGIQLITCRIVEWADDSVNPVCELVEHFGPVGSGVAEHRAIMERYGLTSTEYAEEVEEGLRREWPSSEAVVRDVLNGKGPKRWDLRKSHRVVSIDPPTAKDLDDALSVEVLGNERLRIGVHVADVSHFVPAHSQLDKEAAKRAITVYMPHKTYPMLPRHLSENLCSLLPDVDRLAFTVFFVIDQHTGELCEGERVEFGKSIIRSSARLSYDEVDEAMRGGEHDIDIDVLADIKLLWEVAAKRRSSSRAKDTIRVGSSKVKFEFSSPDSFTPTRCWSESPMDTSYGEEEGNSHGLIEEFMVLANRLVAERLVEGIEMNGKSLPPILRQHPNTEAEVIETILPVLQRGCAGMDWSTERWKGRKLAELLDAARKILPDAVFKAISFEAMVAFQMAQYVVVEDTEESTSHWALGLGRYMHFTSPIRRYADVLVHRLLADLVSMGKESLYRHSLDELIQATARCNQIRKGSLEADRECAYYFFSDYVRANYSDKTGLNLNDLVVTKIFPGKKLESGKSTKNAIEVFVPLVGYSKSVSLEQIGADNVVDINEKCVEFLRKGKTLKWKVLDIIEMNVVCASDEDSVLKHWTLRLPGVEESPQCEDVTSGKSLQCGEKRIPKNSRKSSECGEKRIPKNGGKPTEVDLPCMVIGSDTETTPGEVLRSFKADETVGKIAMSPALWQWLVQSWVLNKKRLDAATAEDTVELATEVLTSLPTGLIVVHPFHATALLSLIATTLTVCPGKARQLLCALREQCGGSWAPPVESVCRILGSAKTEEIREELMRHLSLALDSQAAGKKPFLAVVKHLGEFTGTGSEMVIDHLIDKSYWDGYVRLLNDPEAKGQRPIQEHLFEAAGNLSEEVRAKILPIILERYFQADAPEGFKFFARLSALTDDLELKANLWEMVSKNHKYRLREDNDGSQREALKRFMRQSCDKNFPRGVVTGLAVDAVSHLEFLLREVWALDAPGTAEAHLELMRALVEKGDLVAYFQAFVRSTKSASAKELSNSEKWFKAVTELLVRAEGSMQAAVVQQSVESVKMLQKHFGEGELVERITGAVLEGIRPQEHQVAEVRMLVDSLPPTKCRPLAIAALATRQRLDGWRLPTDEETSDGKTAKLGHSADALLVSILASLNSSSYDDSTMRKCVSKLRKHWQLGASELIWKNELNPNLHAIVNAAEEETISDIAEVIVEKELPFEWRSWPEVLSLAVGEKVVQYADFNDTVKRAVQAAAGSSFVYLSLKNFSTEDLPDYLLPVDSGSLTAGRVELLAAINQEDLRSPSAIGTSLRWSKKHLSWLRDEVESEEITVAIAASACSLVLRGDGNDTAPVEMLQALLKMPKELVVDDDDRVRVDLSASCPRRKMLLLAKMFPEAPRVCREICEVVLPDDTKEDDAVDELIGAALTNEASFDRIDRQELPGSAVTFAHSRRRFDKRNARECDFCDGLLLSVKEGSPSEGTDRPSSVGRSVDKCWVALAKCGGSARRGLLRLIVPALVRECSHSEMVDCRVTAILYGIAVVIEDTMYHQLTERDVEIVLGGLAILGEEEYCSESDDASLYGFALLWTVLASAPSEWLISTLGLIGVRATSALRAAGKRKRDEMEELSWIPYLARYLEKLTKTVPAAALRKYSPVIAAELISRHWVSKKKQRIDIAGENLADDKVDEVVSATLYPLLCEGSAATKRIAGDAASYKSDDVLHLFASAGSDSSREKVKQMLQMYNQRFRYKGRV